MSTFRHGCSPRNFRERARIVIAAGLEPGGPDRLALLRRAAQLRMRNVRPAKWLLNCYLNTFSGTVDGKAALAVLNETEQKMTVNFSDFDLPEEMEEILQPAGMQKSQITVARHDAVLLVANRGETK